jgi:hypothetical protein
MLNIYESEIIDFILLLFIYLFWAQAGLLLLLDASN